MTPADRLRIRSGNIKALCRALESRGLTGAHRLSAAFGPSMTPERLKAVLADGPLPDFLARSIEHMMGVAMYWLDEPHPDAADAASHLLIEQALRIKSPEPSVIAPAVIPVPVPLDA